MSDNTVMMGSIGLMGASLAIKSIDSAFNQSTTSSRVSNSLAALAGAALAYAGGRYVLRQFNGWRNTTPMLDLSTATATATATATINQANDIVLGESCICITNDTSTNTGSPHKEEVNSIEPQETDESITEETSSRSSD